MSLRAISSCISLSAHASCILSRTSSACTKAYPPLPSGLTVGSSSLQACGLRCAAAPRHLMEGSVGNEGLGLRDASLHNDRSRNREGPNAQKQHQGRRQQRQQQQQQRQQQQKQNQPAQPPVQQLAPEGQLAQPQQMKPRQHGTVDAKAAARFQEEYKKALESAGATEQQQQQLEAYLDYMLETNKVMNLTGKVITLCLPCATMGARCANPSSLSRGIL